MSHAPSLRQIREAIEAHVRASSTDSVAVASLREDVAQMREAVRAAIDRVRDFASRGLLSEAASVAEDFPDLARQAEALIGFPRSSAAAARFWQEHIEAGVEPGWMPTAEDVDSLVRITEQASRLRTLLDALRVASLRRESIGSRLAILKKLREADAQNRLWLDQIDALEREWIKRIGEMRTDPGVTREELEEAFSALSTRQWIAPVPRGLKEEIYARVKPMRAEAAGDQYAELVGKIHDAAALMDRAELERLEAAWAQVYHETGRMPDESVQASVASAFEWLSRVAAEERAQAEFDAQVEQLERMLDGRASIADIERQLAILRDGGRSTPEGVLIRAKGYLAAERDRLRRRHRLVLLGSLAAAIAVTVGGVLAITAYSRAQDREAAAAALKGLLDGNAIEEAHALANEIRANPDMTSPELNALLAREERALGEWNLERQRLKDEVARLRGELANQVARARLKQMLQEIEGLTKRAMIPEEKRAMGELALMHAERERERDEADAKTADQGLAEADTMLKDWPLPDRWTPAQSIDPARWLSYIAALDRVKGLLDQLAADVAGSEIQEPRVKTKREGVDARLDEAKRRRDELAAALKSIDSAVIGAAVSEEASLVERLKVALEQHGAILRRLGQDAAFEKSQRFAIAWASIQSWREEVWPKLDLALGRQAGPEATEALLQELQDFIGRYPGTPYRERVAELIRRIDPQAQSDQWAPARVRGALVDTFYANLEEVPFTGGERFLYRRPSPTDRDPVHRVVENLVDLNANPDRLDAYLPKLTDQFAGGMRPCEVSVIWGQTEQALAAIDVTEVQGLLLESLERLRSMQKGDVLFRARALRDLAAFFSQSGHVPAAAQRPLDDWLSRCARLWSNSLSVDWALAAHAPPANIRALRLEAVTVISEFPKLVQIAEAAKAERDRAKRELRPLSPIGVLLMADPPGTPRRIGETRSDGPVVIVIDGPGGFRFLETDLRGNQIAENSEIPAGPVLVFRRSGS